MTRNRIVLLAIALVIIAVAWWQIAVARRGLVIRDLERDGVPMRYLAPEGAVSAPGVVIAHGVAGSRQLMLGYAYTLAHAGYAVLLFDFGGHGANPNPFSRGSLQGDLDTAYSVLIEQGEVDPSRLALLGHSMGSGVVMAAGIRNPERYAAVVAISPTGANVTPDVPRNLLLMAGSAEPQFVANAERLLAAGGGPNDDLAGGRGRALTVIPLAEHITILFRGESHRAAVEWLGRTFGLSTTSSYSDRRIFWYLLHLAGWLLVIVALAPALRSGRPAERSALAWRRWLGLALGALIAVIAVALLNRVLPLQSLLGLTVGGAVAAWLFIGGLVWLACNWPVGRPARYDVGRGLLLFALLWLAFGLMAQFVWVQWWLIPARLWRWPVLALACLPWFLAAGHAQWGGRGSLRVLWWLGQSALIVAGMVATVSLVPSLSFLILIVPLLPAILAALAVAATAFDRPWAYGIGSALFFGWMLAAVFPLV
jgi:dienelactone hydrolase